MSALNKGRITVSRLALAIHLGLFAAAAPVYAAQPAVKAAQPAVLMLDIPAQSLGSAVTVSYSFVTSAPGSGTTTCR